MLRITMPTILDVMGLGAQYQMGLGSNYPQPPQHTYPGEGSFTEGGVTASAGVWDLIQKILRVVYLQFFLNSWNNTLHNFKAQIWFYSLNSSMGTDYTEYHCIHHKNRTLKARYIVLCQTSLDRIATVAHTEPLTGGLVGLYFGVG